MKEDLPAGDLLEMGQRYNDSAAMRRLHAAVVKLPTISASKDEILEVLKRFKCIHHWRGPDGRWLQKIGCDIDIIDLGLLYQRFMAPVKSDVLEHLFGYRLSCRDTKLLLAFCRRCHATTARQGCRMHGLEVR